MHSPCTVHPGSQSLGTSSLHNNSVISPYQDVLCTRRAIVATARRLSIQRRPGDVAQQSGHVRRRPAWRIFDGCISRGVL